MIKNSTCCIEEKQSVRALVFPLDQQGQQYLIKQEVIPEIQEDHFQNQKKPKKQKMKSYKSIDNQTRQKLINEVIHNHKKIKKIALELNINYSSAKSICQTFKKEGRVQKKTSKQKKNIGLRRKWIQKKELIGEEIIQKNIMLELINPKAHQVEIISTFGSQTNSFAKKQIYTSQSQTSQNEKRPLIQCLDKHLETKLEQEKLTNYYDNPILSSSLQSGIQVQNLLQQLFSQDSQLMTSYFNQAAHFFPNYLAFAQFQNLKLEQKEAPFNPKFI